MRNERPPEVNFVSLPPLVSNWRTRMVGCFCPKLSLLPSPRPEEGSSVPWPHGAWRGPAPRSSRTSPAHPVCHPLPSSTPRRPEPALEPRSPAGFALGGPGDLPLPASFWGKNPQKRGRALCCSFTPLSCASRWGRMRSSVGGTLTLRVPPGSCHPVVTTARSPTPVCRPPRALRSPAPPGAGGILTTMTVPGRAARTKFRLLLGTKRLRWF